MLSQQTQNICITFVQCWTTSKMLDRLCTNVVHMFCVCWDATLPSNLKKTVSAYFTSKQILSFWLCWAEYIAAKRTWVFHLHYKFEPSGPSIRWQIVTHYVSDLNVYTANSIPQSQVRNITWISADFSPAPTWISLADTAPPF